ncbi:glycosyltransferase family 2 protein [Candidatus Saccharibacteria bacterium]|nr:glycosyltransferase family 2 protein [Candidatus Saccharibacteria bacterium]
MREKELTLYLVVPCYNEEAVLPKSSQVMLDEMKKLQKTAGVSSRSRIVLVDDGSRDATWEIIEDLAKEPSFVGLKLAHNRGHQNALLAGLMWARERADVVVSMDADLQDDVAVLDDFVARYREGAEIVYGVRNSRATDTGFKRKTAGLFYKLMDWLGVETVPDHADYRLMSKVALEALADYGETNVFLRGLVPNLGFKTAVVKYGRGKRAAGESKYPLHKMLNFAIEGVTSFSVRPLRLIFALGVLLSLVAVGIIIYTLAVKIMGQTVSGWAFLTVSIWLLGGLQMICLGVVGEYIGKIYVEAKRRPRFHIEKTVGK